MQIGPFGVSVANTKDSRLAEQIGGSRALDAPSQGATVSQCRSRPRLARPPGTGSPPGGRVVRLLA